MNSTSSSAAMIADIMLEASPKTTIPLNTRSQIEAR